MLQIMDKMHIVFMFCLLWLFNLNDDSNMSTNFNKTLQRHSLCKTHSTIHELFHAKSDFKPVRLVIYWYFAESAISDQGQIVTRYDKKCIMHLRVHSCFLCNYAVPRDIVHNPLDVYKSFAAHFFMTYCKLLV
jgi:hypothetical protein